MTLKTNQQVFSDNIKQHLSTNLTEKIIANLSNLLAFDYDNRLKDIFSVTEHAKNISDRLKVFLKNKVIDNDDFFTIMTLFIAAIAPEDSGLLSRDNKNIEISAEMIIKNYYSEYAEANLSEIKSILIEILKNLGTDKVIEFIKSDSKTFKSYIDSKLQKNTNRIQINNIKTVINQFVNRTNLLTKKTDKFKQIATKTGLIFGSLSIAALSLVGGIVAPALLIPSLFLATRIAPKIGNVIGEILVKTDYSIKSETKLISSIRQSLLKTISVKINLDLAVDNAEIVEPIRDYEKIKNISNVKDTLDNHVNKISSNAKDSSLINKKQDNRTR